MAGFFKKIDKIKTFVLHDLWEIDVSERSRLYAFCLRQIRLAAVVCHDFFADRCLLRASALTYSTLLSIVPLLALMFALLKGFGVQNTLEPIIMDSLAVGSEEVVSEIIGYINNTNVGQLGIFGLVTLLLGVLALLSNIEKSFNHIWGVDETRPFLRRFADYFSVLTIGPIFIIAAISMTSSLQSNALVERIQSFSLLGPLVLALFKIVPYVGMWIAFTALYIFMPNARVRYQAALLGGILGGTSWQLAQWAYVNFQVGVGRYNAIYGTMAAVPIFMVWIYLSWLIVLVGLEITYAWQHLRVVPSEVRGEQVDFSTRERAALAIMLLVAEAFYNGKESYGSHRISTELHLPPRLARNILVQLVRIGFLSEVFEAKRNEHVYHPGRAPDALTIHEIVQGLKKDGVGYTRLRKRPETDLACELDKKLEDAGRAALEGMSLQDLVLQMINEKKGQITGNF